MKNYVLLSVALFVVILFTQVASAQVFERFRSVQRTYGFQSACEAARQVKSCEVAQVNACESAQPEVCVPAAQVCEPDVQVCEPAAQVCAAATCATATCAKQVGITRQSLRQGCLSSWRANRMGRLERFEITRTRTLLKACN